MTRPLTVALLAALAVATAARANAASVVFQGDPVDAASGLPYEILPGQPLVTAGADGRVGSADDQINTALIGDIDVVVRLGNVPAGGIPTPAVERGALATGVAGAPGVGTPIPFHVYLSDGAVSAAQPYGGLLAAADMDGLPVVVLLFADLNGDGVIGPHGGIPTRQVIALRELEPVGRAVALFSAGVASGSIAVTSGGPPGLGMLRVVATAMALTGTYDPAFFGGFVPNGPLISTAQPYLPERDPARVFSQDIGPLEIGGTLNPSPRAAGVPDPARLDLAVPVDGSSPTVDTALAVAGPAVCARLVEIGHGRAAMSLAPGELILADSGARSRRRLRVVAVDRLGNPTTTDTPLAVEVVADGPVEIRPDRDHVQTTERFSVVRGRRPGISVRTRGTGAGTIQVLVDGAVCQRLPVAVQAERGMAADAFVSSAGRADFRTIGEAVAAAVDRNGDGRIAIAVDDGIYRERVRVTRPVEIFGAGAGRTVIDGGGLGPSLALANPAAGATELTATGGSVGISVEAGLAVHDVEARGNVGAGISIAGSGASASACEARDNGTNGVEIAASGVVDGCLSERNVGAGIVVSGSAAVTLQDTTSVGNGGDGIQVGDAPDPVLSRNQCAGNLGTGIRLEHVSGGMLLGNRTSANGDDGLRLNQSDGALVDGNDCTTNGGHGMRIDRSTADFDAAAGAQAAPGNNDVSDNRKGPLLFD